MIFLLKNHSFETHNHFLDSFLELRHDIFIKKLGWRIPTANDRMEQDEFDNDQAIYLMINNSRGQVVAGARLIPTSTPGIIDMFPELIDANSPRSSRTFEITRFAIDHRKDRIRDNLDLRASLLWGIQATALAIGADKLVSVTYLHLESMLTKTGYSFRRLGQIHEIDGVPTVALEHEVSVKILNDCRNQIRSSEVRQNIRLHCIGNQDQHHGSIIHSSAVVEQSLHD
ncbi:acyl-homoserine-lactone synthase [Xanthomonas campestris]|uniref:Acyl-homoserine-lactone synthase n=1 Tax=Xanthomonas cannabis pv. cannabis TaxID=1885894 RepID=A0A823A0K2_9XANT|nr:acyl-homoserine-lactone synthase [Xanthomonas cannabis]DAD54483.1 TPA_exp: GCN5-related N-acetyltransferase [Xanthomonas cannabis pv. cannabis]